MQEEMSKKKLHKQKEVNIMSTFTMTPEQEARISNEMAQSEEDFQWLTDNYEELQQKHSNEYVAILDKKVIDSSVEIEGLSDRLHEKYSQEKPRIVIEYIHKERPNVVLTPF